MLSIWHTASVATRAQGQPTPPSHSYRRVLNIGFRKQLQRTPALAHTMLGVWMSEYR
jgi:hypothetical protein